MPKDVSNPTRALLFIAFALVASAQPPQFDAKHPPRFEDFPVTEKWTPPPAPIKLATATERMFRTRLTNSAKDPPNFAGHFRFAAWGCGANCISGALVDLQTGVVFPPPLVKVATGPMHFSVCQSAYENSGVEHEIGSRLFILRCGLNYSGRLQKNVPAVSYFVWEEDQFRQILSIR